MTFRHILVPTDLSEAARQAYRHAAVFARAFGAKLTVLHVDELADAGYRDVQELTEYLELVSSARGDRIQQALADFENQGIEAAFEVITGLAKREIDRYARDHDVDLIVMAKQSRPGMERFLLGSTTSRTVRVTETPLLAIHVETTVPGASLDPPPAYDRLMVTTDFHETSRRGLHATKDLAKKLEARVVLCHSFFLPTIVPVAAGDVPMTSPIANVEGARQTAERALADLLEKEGIGEADVAVGIGSSSTEGIVDAAHELSVDLIVIPATGKGAFKRLLLGSTAEGVVKRASQAVLVLPPLYLERFANR